MSWSCFLLSSSSSSSSSPSISIAKSTILSSKDPTPRPTSQSNSNLYWRTVLPALLSVSLSTITSPPPTIAIPSLNSSLPLPATPFSQSKSLPLGLLDGKIRPCPSINPGCISSNPKSPSFAFPWRIPEGEDDPVKKLEEAILKTQKNPRIMSIEETDGGVYMVAEVEGGGFGRDAMEFVVKGDVVGYRCMATKVTYVYPFTTAIGDSKGQQERLKKVVEELGWYAPSFDSMD